MNIQRETYQVTCQLFVHPIWIKQASPTLSTYNREEQG